MRTVVIGIVGGIASGKSLVAQRLAELGALILDGDRVGHEVLRQPEEIEQISQRWGKEVLDEQGQVNRAAMAKIVFSPPPDGPRELAHLEAITHPAIKRRLRERLELVVSEGSVKAVVLDAAVMLKAGWDELCEKIVFVDAPRSCRLARAKERGWSEADFAAREAVQESLHEKRRRADVVVDNAGTTDATFAQVDRFWRSLD